MSNDEHEIITQILNGHSERYGELIDRYKTGLYYHCFKIVRDEDAAEDIAQDTFVQAYQKLRHYDGVHRFSTWLYKIATNMAIDHVRRQRTIPFEDGQMERLASRLPTPEDEAYAHQIRQAVEQLPPKYRRLIQLYYWEERPYGEIAALMAAPAGSIKGWLHRARALLKETLS
jgi:RNA polymerase sigma-70 factor (ECF subfamily)